MERKLSSRQVLMSILSIKKYTSQLQGRGKDYDDFLRYILDLNEGPYPLLKDLAKQTGIPYSKIRTYLLAIYADLMDVEDENLKVPFDEVEYELHLEGIGKDVYLTLENPPVMPIIVEQVTINLFSKYLKTSIFFCTQD